MLTQILILRIPIILMMARLQGGESLAELLGLPVLGLGLAAPRPGPVVKLEEI